MSENRCWECGGVFDRTKPYNGHENWCDTGIKEEEWIESGLTQFESDMDYELRFDKDGRPYLFDAEEEEYNKKFGKSPPQLVYNHESKVWELVKG